MLSQNDTTCFRMNSFVSSSVRFRVCMSRSLKLIDLNTWPNFSILRGGGVGGGGGRGTQFVSLIKFTQRL